MANNLYSSTDSVVGTQLGSIKKGESDSFDVEGDFQYVGLKASAVLYVSKVIIVWDVVQPVDFEQKEYSVALGMPFDAPTITPPAGKTVSYSSTDTSVATVDANTGAVTILAVGTTTIRATYEDGGTTVTASYTLKVSTSALFAWDATQQGYENGASLTTVTDDTDPVQMVFSKGEGSNAPAYSTDEAKAVCFYANNTLRVSAPEGYAINGITINFCDSYAYTIGTNVGSVSIVEKVGTWTGISPYVVLKNASGIQSNFSSITVSYTKLTEVGEVTVKSVGVATYCPVGQTVVVGDGTKTYIYTGLEENGTTLKEEALPVVPQETGVMIAGTSGETTTYKLYSSDALTATAPSSNMLVGVTEDNTSVPVGGYVLQNGAAGLAFYYVDVAGKIKVNAGKAYLGADANPVKAALFFKGGAEPDVVGISSVFSDEGSVEAIYNLQGIQQEGLQRGINIIRLSNGKTIKRILP